MISVAEWNSATTLDVLSIHDTMNHTARPDGAHLPRAQAGRSAAAVVAMSNRGDSNGEVIADATSRRSAARSTCRRWTPPDLRAIGDAYRIAFDAWDADDVAYNRPYLGGHETTTAGPMLRALEPLAVVRPKGGRPRAAAVRRLAERVPARVPARPRVRWCAHAARERTGRAPDDRVEWLAERLRHAHDLVRAWGDSLAR